MSPIERELVILREINERHFKQRGQDIAAQASAYVAFVNEHGREPTRDETQVIEAAGRGPTPEA